MPIPLGYKHSEETKRKLREQKLGSKNPQFGKKRTKEEKEKISLTLIGKMAGEKHPNFGKHLSESHRVNIGLANKGRVGYWTGK